VNLKEHLQFLIMMIPTLLLLIAAVVTLAAPAKAAQLDAKFAPGEFAFIETEIGPVQTVVVR
jgi:hypothetical protein